MNSQKKIGKFIGVGVGPGDPELLTQKAYRYIHNAKVISYLSNAQGKSQAKWIAREAMQAPNYSPLQIPICMPMSDDREMANQVYDVATIEIKKQLSSGDDVIFLCEGDPLFFGSFSYLLERIQGEFVCQVIPGISSVNAASASLVQPLTQLTESFAVVSGRHSDEVLKNALKSHDSVVIMKAGRARPRIIKALIDTNRLADACYLEYIGREQERVVKDVSLLKLEPGPYFSLFVIRKKAIDCE